MKANSVIFPLTNPSERPDKGRRLADVGIGLSKITKPGRSRLNPAFIWGMLVEGKQEWKNYCPGSGRCSTA